jgi:hypothetical protein
MHAADLPTSLGLWFGYGHRWRLNVIDAARAVESARALAISCPRGAAVAALADRLRASGRRVTTVRSEAADDMLRVREALHLKSSALIVIAEELRADDLLADAQLAADCVLLRVPLIRERREDLSRLLGDARKRADAQLGLERSSIRDEFVALHAYAWPGHLDEIDRVVRGVCALRATGSLRRAASLLGLSKSTLADQLRVAGIR